MNNVLLPYGGHMMTVQWLLLCLHGGMSIFYDLLYYSIIEMQLHCTDLYYQIAPNSTQFNYSFVIPNTVD